MARCRVHGPVQNPVKDRTVLLAAMGLLVVSGFFTCGLGWLFLPLAMIALMVDPGRCPTCGAQVGNWKA